MARCPSCGSECPEGKPFCAECGAAVDLSAAPTETKGWDRSADLSHPSESRFIPGTILAKRYRIVGLLGRGGMGEVYRADDLKLGQPVALKFLHAAVEKDRDRLDRFINEVRSALRVSHPNICRVHDIGEVDGHHYLSMEYVDGEDLASLLRRIGRLPQDKAVQIARQLCAGLAAAHEQGILHRDLKPANVMIDGRGRAKITDFGLADLAEGIEGAELRAGTPQYMSPEQHAGREVTVRSDIYSLGLVLYELLTGKPAFTGKSAAEIRRLQEESTPSRPSSHVDGLDPVVERIILRCLETDPVQRPPSALAVAAALPGGDPLAAALAAGETPSPEMVAAAGEKGVLRPAIGISCLAAVVVGFVALVFLKQPVSLTHYVAMDKHPEALAERAREIIADLGLPAEADNSAYGFFDDDAYRWYVAQEDQSPDRWQVLGKARPPAVRFWYRQTNASLVPWRATPRTTFVDPPDDEGSVRLQLDMEGHLMLLDARPPFWRESEGAPNDVDWSVLFEAAGLDPASFEQVQPIINPLYYCETLAAWRGFFPERPEIPMRLHACAYRGVPVYFKCRGPWLDSQERIDEIFSEPTWTEIATDLLWTVLPLLTACIAGVLVIRHLRLGRGDSRGAMRVAVVLAACSFLAWLLSPDHVLGRPELRRLEQAVADSLLGGALAWVFYMALEPFVRRHWPSTIISWSRLLAGRALDPLVGRDILVGIMFGLGYQVLNYIDRLMGSWLGISAPRLVDTGYPWEDFIGFGRMSSFFLRELAMNLLLLMGILLGLALMRVLLRGRWPAVAVVFVIVTVWLIGELSEPPLLSLLLNALITATILFCLLRFGLLATIAGAVSTILIGAFPLTTDLSLWYAPATIFPAVVILALALYGFVVSLHRGRRERGT